MFKMEGAFLTRHSKKPKGEDKESEQYPGISESGVELAKERAVELKELIEQSEPGSVIFIGGGSDMVRTKSTAEAYGDELKNIYSGEGDVTVLTKGEIEAMRNKEGKAIEKVKEIVNSNPDKKIVIDYPLFLNELSMVRSGWIEEDGKTYTPYLKDLLERNGNDEYKAFREWIATNGMGKDFQGPVPQDEAARYLQAVQRLGEFAKKMIPDRPITVGAVGHSWAADAVVVWLANGRKIDLEGFDRLADGEIIKETELVKMSFNSGKESTITYRGKGYGIPWPREEYITGIEKPQHAESYNAMPKEKTEPRGLPDWVE